MHGRLSYHTGPPGSRSPCSIDTARLYPEHPSVHRGQLDPRFGPPAFPAIRSTLDSVPGSKFINDWDTEGVCGIERRLTHRGRVDIQSQDIALLRLPMGHATSSLEATQPPRKISHKLSKPRVGRHASRTAGLLSSNGCLAPSTTRRSNSHGSGGLPARPSTSPNPPPSSPLVSRFASLDLEVGIRDNHLRRHPDSTVRGKSNDGNLFSSGASQTQLPERHRRASINTAFLDLGGVRRIRSVANPPTDCAQYPNSEAPRFARLPSSLKSQVSSQRRS